MSSENPYAAPRCSADLPVLREKLREKPPVTRVSAWMRTWFSIGLSGVVFGIIGGPIGMIVGGVIAFPTALVVTSLAIPLIPFSSQKGTLSLGRMRFRAAVAGFLSGFISNTLLTSGRLTVFALAAGLVGAVGGLLGHSFR